MDLAEAKRFVTERYTVPSELRRRRLTNTASHEDGRAPEARSRSAIRRPTPSVRNATTAAARG